MEVKCKLSKTMKGIFSLLYTTKKSEEKKADYYNYDNSCY